MWGVRSNPSHNLFTSEKNIKGRDSSNKVVMTLNTRMLKGHRKRKQILTHLLGSIRSVAFFLSMLWSLP
jgi:hypothetical protein